MADYYTLLTTVGAAQLANAQALGTSVALTYFAVGDGDGAEYEPSETQTALVGEVWRGQVNQIYVHADNANWLVIEAIIPEETGGWHVREIGIFDDAGNLFAVGKVPVTYKPVLASGSAKDLYVRMILEISNASDVVLKIDPAIVLASRQYVADLFAEHGADPNAHELLNTYDIPFMAGWGGDGAGEDVAVQIHGAVLLTRDVTFLGEGLRSETAPTGAAIVADIKINGATVYATPPEIADGDNTGTAGVLKAAMVEASAGDLVTFELLQVGSESAGQKLTFTLKGKVR